MVKEAAAPSKEIPKKRKKLSPSTETEPEQDVYAVRLILRLCFKNTVFMFKLLLRFSHNWKEYKSLICSENKVDVRLVLCN